MTNTTHRYMLALEIGEEAIQQGQWQQALICFQTALTGLPREPRVYNGLGDTHLAMADRQRALLCYKEAARLAGDDPRYIDKVADIQEQLGLTLDAARSRLMSGDIEWSRGNVVAAEARWQRAVRAQADLTAGYERLALACRRRGDRAGEARHYMRLADILRRAGRCLMALHVCYTTLTDRPDDPLVWAATDQAWRCVAARDRQDGLANARVETGDLLNATADFAQWQMVAEIRQSILSGGNSAPADGVDPAAYQQLREAILNEGQGRAGVAIAAYEKAIAAGLVAPPVFFALGLLYRLVGRRADAHAALRLAARHPFYRRAVALLE
jgi:tetratricopeptide (TPR) repeat protein